MFVVAIIARVLKLLYVSFSPPSHLEGGSVYSGRGGVRSRGVFGGGANGHPCSEAVLPGSRDSGAGGLRLSGQIDK